MSMYELEQIRHGFQRFGPRHIRLIEWMESWSNRKNLPTRWLRVYIEKSEVKQTESSRGKSYRARRNRGESSSDLTELSQQQKVNKIKTQFCV